MSDIIGNNKLFIINCNNCVHYLGQGSCKAFPRIPISIIKGEVKHDVILPSQIGNYVYVLNSIT